MKSQQMWNKLAGNWDKPGVGLGENDKKIIEKVRPYLSSDSVMLDYGCATGSIVLELAASVKKAYGLDFSRIMIDKASQKAANRKTENVSFIAGTIFDENLEEGSYDVILALSVLHLLENKKEALNRIYNLLKPGGIFITVNPCLKEKNIISPFLRSFLFLAFAVRLLPRVKMYTKTELEQDLARAHFKILDNTSLAVNILDERYIAAKGA